MTKLTLRRIACIAVAILAAACGSGNEALDGPHPGSGDSGAGGVPNSSDASTSYLSEFRNATERALLRRRLAARTFSIPVDQVDALVYYSYNDWGQAHDCNKGGYHGGHSGIDYQTKSVNGTATADVPIYFISAGTFVAFRTYTWGITAIVRSRVPNAATGQDQDIYFHYLHLRSANQSLRPGDAVSTSTNLGIQGGPTPGDSNFHEHVHLEVALEELRYGYGAHPSLCSDSTDATLDPYPILAGLFDGGSQSGNTGVDGGFQSGDTGAGGLPRPVTYCGNTWYLRLLVQILEVWQALLGGYSFDVACQRHDACYGDCGTPRIDCDQRLRADAEGVCEGAQMTANCVAWAETFYQVVSEKGDNPFRQARANCPASPFRSEQASTGSGLTIKPNGLTLHSSGTGR